MSKGDGWIQKKVRKSPRTGKVTTKFVARYTPPGGVETSKSFDKYGRSNEPGTAAHWLDQQREATRKGQWVNPREREWTVGEWADEWLASYTGITKDSLDSYRDVIEFDIKPSGLGDEPLRSVDRIRMGKWIRELTEDRWWAPDQKPLARSTATKRRTITAMIFGAAHDDELIPRNPMRRVRVAKDDVTVEAILPEELPTPDELWKLYETAQKHSPLFAPQILVAAGTGLRPGEILGLQRAHIRNRELHVVRQRQMKAPTPIYGPPKSAAGRRRVPFGDTVEQALTEHLEAIDPGKDDPIFLSRGRGGRIREWHRSTWSDHWRRIVEAAGLEHRRFYLWRHYYASVLIEGGASPTMVMTRMGHSNSKHTLERYAHLWPNTEEVTRELSEHGLRRDKDGTIRPEDED